MQFAFHLAMSVPAQEGALPPGSCRDQGSREGASEEGAPPNRQLLEGLGAGVGGRRAEGPAAPASGRGKARRPGLPRQRPRLAATGSKPASQQRALHSPALSLSGTQSTAQRGGLGLIPEKLAGA